MLFISRIYGMLIRRVAIVGNKISLMFNQVMAGFSCSRVWTLLLVVGFLGFLAGCERVEDLDKNDPLRNLIGVKYETLVDCYVVNYSDKLPGASYPMITCNINKPGVGSPELPLEAKESNVGKDFGGVKVVGIVPSGSKLKVIGIKKLVSIESKILIFDVNLLTPTKGFPINQEYSIIWLLNRKSPELGLDEDVARMTY